MGCAGKTSDFSNAPTANEDQGSEEEESARLLLARKMCVRFCEDYHFEHVQDAMRTDIADLVPAILARVTSNMEGLNRGLTWQSSSGQASFSEGGAHITLHIYSMSPWTIVSIARDEIAQMTQEQVFQTFFLRATESVQQGEAFCRSAKA